MKKMETYNNEFKEKIQQQEKKDLTNCLQFFNYQFDKIEYQIPEDIRSDVYITATTILNNEIEYNVEIKQRNCNIDTYPDSILQVDKYNYLVSDKTKIPVYYVIYNDCIAVYNLSKIDINKVEKRWQQMNRNTLDYSDKKIYKEVYGLTPNLATIFNKYNYNKIRNANHQQVK